MPVELLARCKYEVGGPGGGSAADRGQETMLRFAQGPKAKDLLLATYMDGS